MAILLNLIPILTGVLATGAVGAGLTSWWSFQFKLRESDLAMEKAFHNLYGEFFAVWKLWNYYVRDIGPEAFPGGSRWKLLERASAAEGSMEAILIGLASKNRRSPTSLVVLAKFRQLYQQLRESIRNNRALDWDSSDHPVYMAFKQLTPVISYMIRTGKAVDDAISSRQTEAWLEATHNKYEEFWSKS